MSLKLQIKRCLESLDQILNDPEFLALPKDSRESLRMRLVAVHDSLSQTSKALSDDPGDNNGVRSKQDIWERRLLDLSFRNSLLNLRYGQRAISVDQDSVSAFKDRVLAGDEVLMDDLLATISGAERKRLVRNLFRISRLSLDETGANTLFLTFGVLSFADESASKFHEAPVLLLPVDLVRRSKEKYVLRRRGEDIVLNVTLIEYLAQVVGLDVSSLRRFSGNGTIDYQGIFAEIENIISSRKDWHVERKCVLGLFSFTKFVMWNDIHSHRDVLRDHPVLCSLVEGRLMTDVPEVLDVRDLDKNSAPDRFALPLDYDSSQLAAVAEAEKGTSFILYGPPGTGKSQTITNIIADACYKGKRILFVAEKKAALEVVQRRLEKTGLAPFCLELHGNNADKRHFLAQMERVLSVIKEADGQTFRKASMSLYSKRLELIEQLESLHSRGDGDWSLSECIDGYLRLDGPVVDLPPGWTKKKTKEDIDSITEACLSMDAGESILGVNPADFPLYGLIPKVWSERELQFLKTALTDLALSIEWAEKQASSDMNVKFMKKTPSQILRSDYRWRKLSQIAVIEDSLTEDFPRLKEAVSRWLGSLDMLPVWMRFLEPRKALINNGLEDAVRLFDSGFTGDQVSTAFLRGFFKRSAQDKIDEDPTLSRFNGVLFSQVIENYRKESAFFRQLTQDEIISRLTSRIPFDSRDPIISSELTYLKKRIASKGRGVTIRSILENIPNLLPVICPCILMSPLSVAQFIPMESPKFDLVVFDEASQIPTSEAVGAIARAKSVIVVGDPKQMPPTDFFSASVVGEDEVDADDLDSILDDCIALSMPSHHLEWHYRSSHESLISFSNKEFYDNSLVTFPSVDNQVSRVSLRQVKGIYDYGKSRTNKVEAQAIVDEVTNILRTEDKPSIGIIAFSMSQSNLIEDLLMDVLSKDPFLETKAFSGEEPLFVKNLENVQGDERDVILFSVGYGPDERGSVSMNFGPLNKVGGERRLNVAVTRARREMIVFSSLDPDQIDLRRTNATGALELKHFLEYSRKWSPVSAGSRDSISSDMVASIAKSLSEYGYSVHSDVGSSDFKLDLAIVDPDNSLSYCLGIIIDGMNYYRLKTVSDREVVRPQILDRLGWKITRVWTIDWFLHPDRVMSQIMTELKSLEK